MYKTFYNLSFDPFRNTPDPSIFFEGGDRKAIADALLYVIERSEGITKVVGDVGSGKTTLLRMVAQRLMELGYQVAYIPSPLLQPEDMLRFILRELGLPTDMASKFEMYDLLYRYFTDRPSLKGLVILIDEAHLIPRDTLEEIRLLTNLESDNQKFVQVVLFGQQELDTLLDLHENRQLKSRISHQFYLGRLNAEEVYQYLNYRMNSAGFGLSRPFFDRRIAAKIYRLTRGIPREINNLADKVLLNAFMRKGQYAMSRDLPAYDEVGRIRTFGFVGVLFVLIGAAGYWVYEMDPYFFHLFTSSSRQIVGLAGGKDQGASSQIRAPVSAPDGKSKVGTATEAGQSLPPEKASASVSAVKAGRPVQRLPNTGYYIALATTPCEDRKFIRSVVKSIRTASSRLLTMQYGAPLQCKLLMGPFAVYAASKAMLARLPSRVQRLGAYIIPATKLNKIIDNRHAKVYRGIH
ncbi:hypothetical protein D6779_01280 [Candidatus Parcubacteria bacterium]|nr:MAG: hypothetical protein D6779_01280 [Candidatus Parcubacteria bacterium]